MVTCRRCNGTNVKVDESGGQDVVTESRAGQVSEFMTTDAARDVVGQVRRVGTFRAGQFAGVSVVVRPMPRRRSTRTDVPTRWSTLRTDTLMCRVVRSGVAGPHVVVSAEPKSRAQHNIRRAMPLHPCRMFRTHRRAVPPFAGTSLNGTHWICVPLDERCRSTECSAAVKPVVVGLAQSLTGVFDRPFAALDTTVHTATLPHCAECNSGRRVLPYGADMVALIYRCLVLKAKEAERQT